jgi:hypothetical protein
MNQAIGRKPARDGLSKPEAQAREFGVPSLALRACVNLVHHQGFILG